MNISNYLGGGAFADVFSLKDEISQQIYAVKIMKPDNTNQDELNREIEIN